MKNFLTQNLLTTSCIVVVIICCLTPVTVSWLTIAERCDPKIHHGGYFERVNSDQNDRICNPIRRLRCNPRSKRCECDGGIQLQWDEEAGDDRVKAHHPDFKRIDDKKKGDCRVIRNKHCFITEDCWHGLKCVNFGCTGKGEDEDLES